MTPKERVWAALRHEEPDRVPLAEFAIDYPVIEAILGRETFCRGHFKEVKAYWEGRRDEVVESYKRDVWESSISSWPSWTTRRALRRANCGQLNRPTTTPCC